MGRKEEGPSAQAELKSRGHLFLKAESGIVRAAESVNTFKEKEEASCRFLKL